MNKHDDPVTKAERLSALVDNETSPFETRRLIDELLTSEEDRATWARYHLIGDSVRGGLQQPAPADFLAGIHAGIADTELELEPQPQPRQAGLPRWMRPLAGVGVAAAVAVVSLVGLQKVLSLQQEALPMAATEMPVSAERVVDTTPDPRFARYLDNHAELITPGASSFARVRNSVADE